MNAAPVFREQTGNFKKVIGARNGLMRGGRSSAGRSGELTGRHPMRRYLSILVAGAMAASSVSFAPAQAAMVRSAPAISTENAGAIEEAGGRRHWRKHRRHWDNHSHWRPRHRHHRRHYNRGFSFNFAFPVVPYYAYRHRPRCRDLVLGYDGRWHCYRW
jgi:hypothetical protein